MRTFRLIGMALIAMLMCVNFTACSSDDDENDANSTIELLQGVWYDAYTDGHHYFIVEKDHCYSGDKPSTVYAGEKYKYTFDSKTNMMSCYYYDKEENKYSDEAWYIRIKSISDTKLILELFDEDNQTFDDTREYVRQK